MLITTTRAIARTSMMIASIAVAATITIAAARVGIAAAEPTKAPTVSHGPKEPSNSGSTVSRPSTNNSSMRRRPTVASRSCT